MIDFGLYFPPRQPATASLMKSHTIPCVASFAGRAKQILAVLVFLGWVVDGVAQQFASTEDRSRFQEQPYKQAEPGMLSPSEYVALAEKAVHTRYRNFNLNRYSDGAVTRRFYHNAPVADRDIICVQFVYRTPLGGGGRWGQGYLFMKADQPVPVLQALIRKDRTKIYVNWVRYKRE